MITIYFLWSLSLSLLVSASLIKTHNCANLNDNEFLVDMPFIEAYYDYAKSNRLEYFVRTEVHENSSISDINSTTNRYTTLHVELDFLDGLQVDDYFRLCNQITLSNGSEKGDDYMPDFALSNPNNLDLCPLQGSDPFFIQYVQNVSDFHGFSSFSIRFSIISNSEDSPIIGCAESYITPQFPVGYKVAINIILPSFFFIVIVVHWCGEFLSPYRESRMNCLLNYVSAICNRSYLNHLTPSVVSFLQYIQFAFFNAGLNVLYPGYYQPIMSAINWCALVTVDLTNYVVSQNANSNDHLYLDYYDDGLSGITAFNQKELQNYGWRSFMICTVIVIAVEFVISVLTLSICWYFHKKTRHDDGFFNGFKTKTLYYFTGQVLYVYYSLFALPFLVLSLYQFSKFVSNGSHSERFSSIFGFILVIFWILGLIFFLSKYVFNKKISDFNKAASWKNGKRLYTSVKISNLFGFTYFEYKPNKLYFIVYEYVIMFVKAVVIACVQSSGIAQVIMLLFLEIIYTLLVITCKPFYSAKNQYQSKKREKNKKHRETVGLCFSRIVVVMLNIPYIETLDIPERTRSIVGYVQMGIHCLVGLYFGFAAICTLIDIFRSRHQMNRSNVTESINYPLMSSNFKDKSIMSFEDDLQLQSPSPTASLFNNSKMTLQPEDPELDAYGRKKNVDYSVREADLYMYGVNSPMLNNDYWEPESEIQQIWNKRDGNINSANPMQEDSDSENEDDDSEKIGFSKSYLGLGFVSKTSQLVRKQVKFPRKRSTFSPEPQTSGFQVRRPKDIVVKDISETQKLNEERPTGTSLANDVIHEAPEEAYHK